MTLPELLCSRPIFVLPPSQRVYGWGEDQVDRLFSDLGINVAGLPVRSPQDVSSWLFLGTVYLADETRGCTAIADGQQRIVTGTMLYAAARDLETRPERKAHLHACIGAVDGGDDASPYRLRLRDIDQAFFRRWVQEPGATLKPYTAEATGEVDDTDQSPLSDSQTNILNNRNLIVERLRSLMAAGREHLFEFLANSSELVVITSHKLEDATYAYASTHKRGLKQATTDKLKAEILRDATADRRADLANHWDECEAKLGKDALEDLLQLMVLNDSGAIANGDLQTEVLDVFDLPKTAESFIAQQLVPATLAYRQIIGKREHLVRFLDAGLRDRSRVKRIKGLLETMMRATHIEWRAPALTMLLQAKNDLTRLERLLARLERLAAVYMIAGHEPACVQQRYADITMALRTNDETALDAAFFIEQPLRGKARDQILSANFAIKSRYRMPVLLKVNDLLAGDVVAVSPAAVSCEHILPQNVGKDNPAWYLVFRSPNGERYVGHNFRHRLGNITILSHPDNRAAGARAFSEKRSILQKSAYVISQNAGNMADWNISMVEARTAQLAKLLIEHWEL
jgi:hypothetical protein